MHSGTDFLARKMGSKGLRLGDPEYSNGECLSKLSVEIAALDEAIGLFFGPKPTLLASKSRYFRVAVKFFHFHGEGASAEFFPFGIDY